MKLFGAMVSFEIKGDRAAAMALPNHTRIFTRATSLGGVESLIEHRQSIEGPDTRTPETLLRLSIGLEHPDDLIADLDRALALIAALLFESLLLLSAQSDWTDLRDTSRAGARGRHGSGHATRS